MISRYTRPEMGAVWDEENKYRIWLNVEILACEGQKKMGLLSESDLQVIKDKAQFSVQRIAEIEKSVDHDVIAFLTNVAEYIGEPARHLHYGLTSSDVVDTALAVMLVQAADLLIDDLKKLRIEIAEQARRYKNTPMIGRTHGIHAEPITFGLKMALMYDEFGRALRRMESARETVAVGKLSGAVGTHAHLDPQIEDYVCRHLGLKPANVSTQVVQRDCHAEFVSVLALVGASIERWAQEFRHLQRTEVHEIEEFFGKEQKGSSAMPHKKNPILAERLCGLARLLRGYAVTAMENVPLWHERDISHSSAERVILPDATIILDYMLTKLTVLVKQMRVFPDRMKANMDMTHGLIHSQQVLLLLTEKGVAREKAYRIVQRHAMQAWETGQPLQGLLLADKEVLAALNEKEIKGAFDLAPHFRDVDRVFKLVGI